MTLIAQSGKEVYAYSSGKAAPTPKITKRKEFAQVTACSLA